MINEFFSHAKPTNNKAKQLFITLLSAGALITIVYIIANRYRGIIGLFALAAIVGAVFIYTKYIGVEYYYDITFDSQGSAVFVVRQISGKRQTTLCRLDLYAISDVKLLNSKERKAHKPSPGYKKYFYLPTLSPESVILITVNSPRELAEITIEASEDFAKMLRSYSLEARETRFDDEEY